MNTPQDRCNFQKKISTYRIYKIFTKSDFYKLTFVYQIIPFKEIGKIFMGFQRHLTAYAF